MASVIVSILYYNDLFLLYVHSFPSLVASRKLRKWQEEIWMFWEKI